MTPSADVSELLARARERGAAGDLAGAEHALRDALASQPGNAEALQLLGIARWQAGDLAGAQAALDDAARAAPGAAPVHYALAGVVAASAGPGEATAHYERAAALAPDFWQAWADLGIARAESGDLGGAIDALLRARGLNPEDAGVLFALGQAQAAAGRLDEAAATLADALSRAPGDASVTEALAAVLRHTDRAAEARDVLVRALAADPGQPALHLALGHALDDLGEREGAMRSYRDAVDRDPESLAAHEALNRLLWEDGGGEGHLQSYARAVDARPGARPLRVAWAGWLTRAERFTNAEAQLREALRMDDADPHAHRLLARTLINQGRADEGLEHLRRAVAQAPCDPRGRLDLARLLLVLGAPDEALPEVRAALAAAPLDQEALAYQGIAWRLLGDPREARLNDYERFVRSYRVPVPDGYPDIAAFNRDLDRALDALHHGTRPPPDQTLRGGTQTRGHLFERRAEAVQKVRASIAACVERYIADMADDGEHPLLSRRSAAFHFATAWSCRLASAGFHTNHVHPKGWISSCYYVSLPDAVREADGRQGWLKFGETNLGLGKRERIARTVQPEEGLLVLFPSYVFHGTVPFTSDQARTTIAFDVVPG